ncbi:ArnT family glycosyltransferase [Chthonomonas calidirosea]|uniref:ArnT family glycosyltransferase n=1 Tax=Chthonomonas calidirosea TaxID=454171 RepID=UPI0006EC96AA|nr:glycosyltransferase family 39 protein [Chthonomonas calidirosea]CEK14444.1 PMT family glycosyltransferase, 4-amino-4-deoxy-L-arabinose transferase [Chthonomonas calidirosea]
MQTPSYRPLQTKKIHLAALLFLLITTLLRLPLLKAIDLVPDEAYYWDWSRHLALGYYDQGPFIAYLIRLTTAIFGTNEFGVRIGVCLLTAGTLLCVYQLALLFFSPQVGFLTLVLLALSPLVAVGSQIATYDPPLVFFWTLTLLQIAKALFVYSPYSAQQRRAWLIAGIFCGFGLLSKHTLLLLPGSLLLYLLLTPPQRFWLRRWEPYAALGIMLVMYSGVLWWNAQHHWWTFLHLFFLVHHHGGNPLHRFGDFLASQALFIGPVIFLGSFGASLSALCTKAPLPHRFLAFMGLPSLLLFCLLAFKTKVQANWVPFAYPSLCLLWVGRYLSAEKQRKPFTNIFWFSLAAISTAFLTLLLFFPRLRLAVGIHIPPKSDITNTAFGWRTLAKKVQQIRSEMEMQGHKVFISGNGYQYIALMAFYLPDHPPTYDLFLHYRLDMYAAYVQQLKRHIGEDSIFINAGKANDADLHKVFARVQWLPPVRLYRRPLYRHPIATIYLAKCYGYRLYTGLRWARGG